MQTTQLEGFKAIYSKLWGFQYDWDVWGKILGDRRMWGFINLTKDTHVYPFVSAQGSHTVLSGSWAFSHITWSSASVDWICCRCLWQLCNTVKSSRKCRWVHLELFCFFRALFNPLGKLDDISEWYHYPPSQYNAYEIYSPPQLFSTFYALINGMMVNVIYDIVQSNVN